MPEGPSIRLLAEKCQQFVGKTIVRAEALTDDLPLERFTGQKILSIQSFGKQLLLSLTDFNVRVHLMLFGYYRIDTHLPQGKLRLGLKFNEGELNFYAADIRIFGEPLDEVYDLRVDVMHPSFDVEMALEKLGKLKRSLICDVLLDQSIFAGVGNIIKNDMLFKSRIHPANRVEAIPGDRLLELVRTAPVVSNEFYTWIKTRKRAREVIHYKKICPRDRSKVIKVKMGKGRRPTYYCECCQELFS